MIKFETMNGVGGVWGHLAKQLDEQQSHNGLTRFPMAVSLGSEGGWILHMEWCAAWSHFIDDFVHPKAFYYIV